MKNKYVLVALLVVFVISVMGLGLVSCVRSNNVYADELTDNAILNFNQLYNYNNIRSNYYNINFSFVDNYIVVTGKAPNWGNYPLDCLNSSTSVNTNDYYYVSVTIIGTPVAAASNSNFISGNARAGICKFTSSTTNIGFNCNANEVFDFKYRVILVNLTQMFGAGNEPTSIDEVRSYLPLDYYNYTTGTPISSSYLSGYNQSLLDLQKSYDIKFGGNDLQSYIVSFDYNGVSSGVSVTEFNGTSQVFFSGYSSINLPFTLKAGDSLDLNFNAGLSLNGYYLNFGYLNNGVITNIARSSYTDSGASIQGFQWHMLSNQKVTLNIPVDLNSIIIYLTDSNGNIVPAYSGNGATSVTRFELLNYSIKTQNLSALISMQQDSYYKRGLKVGYDNGFRAGQVADNPYTFRGLIGAVLDAPVQAITGLLDFDILGVNMKGLYLSLFTLALIIAVTKLCLGK